MQEKLVENDLQKLFLKIVIGIFSLPLPKVVEVILICVKHGFFLFHCLFSLSELLEAILCKRVFHLLHVVSRKPQRQPRRNDSNSCPGRIFYIPHLSFIHRIGTPWIFDVHEKIQHKNTFFCKSRYEPVVSCY